MAEKTQRRMPAYDDTNPRRRLIQLPAMALFVIPVINCGLIAFFNWKLAVVQVSSILLLLYVMRRTSKLQKKIAMNLEVTEAQLRSAVVAQAQSIATVPWTQEIRIAKADVIDDRLAAFHAG